MLRLVRNLYASRAITYSENWFGAIAVSHGSAEDLGHDVAEKEGRENKALLLLGVVIFLCDGYDGDCHV